MALQQAMDIQPCKRWGWPCALPSPATSLPRTPRTPFSPNLSQAQACTHRTVAPADLRHMTRPVWHAAGPDGLQVVSPSAGRPRGLPRLENAASKALHNILDAVRQERSSYLHLRVIKARLLCPSNMVEAAVVCLESGIASHLSPPLSMVEEAEADCLSAGCGTGGTCHSEHPSGIVMSDTPSFGVTLSIVGLPIRLLVRRADEGPKGADGAAPPRRRATPWEAASSIETCFFGNNDSPNNGTIFCVTGGGSGGGGAVGASGRGQDRGRRLLRAVPLRHPSCHPGPLPRLALSRLAWWLALRLWTSTEHLTRCL